MANLKVVLFCLISLILVALTTSYLTYIMIFGSESQGCKSDSCLLELPTGFVKGFKKKSVLNEKNYFAFNGIPYAERPIGQLRFKDPLPSKPWTGVVDGSFANVCPQIDSVTRNYTGNEDCLFINVYTPQLPESNHSKLLPVMVWIHGGSFAYGSGADDVNGPDFLIEYDVIIVTFNYRLNVLGFLSLGNSEAPGNAGLKDQNLALSWVQFNIQLFGGDRNKVTLFGENAGSVSVHYHTLIPQSSGLFNKVILQSGTALNSWAFNKDPVSCAFNLGKILGFESSKTEDLLEFLLSLQPEVLVENQAQVKCGKEEKLGFIPSKEVAETGSNFLIENPETLLKSQQFSLVPYIIGMTDKEGMVFLDGDMEKSPDNLKAVYENIQNFIPKKLCEGCDVDDFTLQKIKKNYFDNQPLSWSNISKFIDLATDLYYTIGIEITLHLLTRRINVPPIYIYKFTFEGNLGYTRSAISSSVNYLPPGVAHADDVGYLFHKKINSENLTSHKNSREITTIKNICTLWTNFAKYSNPNDKRLGIEWKRTFSQNQQFLDIGEKLKMFHGHLLENRTSFWNEVIGLFEL